LDLLSSDAPTTTGEQLMTDQLPPKEEQILRLAAIIREVDGNHSLGAGALAEAILSHHLVIGVLIATPR
jgi:hypothetical protein